MKKIVYLHGLESAQGGPKVSFLEKENIIYAPKMYYEDPTTYKKVLDEIIIFKPDLIIGSSMGGYYAYLYGSNLEIPLLLFNPALNRISIDDGLFVGNKEVKGYCVLGKKDKEVNPIQTNNLLKQYKDMTVEFEAEMGHRTTFEIFKNKVDYYLFG